MILAFALASLTSGSGRSPSVNGPSRRSFLQAGVAAGGGLMLSLSLPFANGEAEAADANEFAPNAFIRIEGDGQIVLTMLYVEMGQGHLYRYPDADRRRAGGGAVAGAPGTCPAQRKTLRKSLAGRRARYGRLDRDARSLEADARSRRERENLARVGGRKALECGSGLLPRAKR